MARGNFMQNSFLSGEWSPFSQGKTNEAEYYSAANVMLNMVPTDVGAVARRSGTRFSAHARDDTGLINLIEFVSETADALVVELTSLIARFHAAGTLLTDGTDANVLSISSATPAVVTTSAAHGWSTGDTVVFSGLTSERSAPLYNRQYRITVLSATTFSMAHTGPLGTGSVDGTDIQFAALDNITVDRVTERTLPYTGAQVGDVKHAAEENTLYLFHPAHEVRTIDRVGLVVTEQEFLDGPYLDQNTTATTLAFSGTSGSVTVTASGTAGINGGSGFQTTDVGRTIRVNTGTEESPAWSWLKITARASPTSVTATIRGENLSSGSATTLWRIGVYSDTTQWPAHGVIHEGRLWLVGPSGRIDASKSGDFFNFEPTSTDGTVADDNGVSAIFAGSGRQNPQWLQSIDTGLLVGTDGGEYLVRASSLDDPLSPFTVQLRKLTDYGCSDALPVRAGKNTIFIHSVERNVMEYRSAQGGMDGNDIARDARHLTSKGISELAYSQSPIPTVWMRRGDGRLCAVTYRDDLQGRTVAWHRHSLDWTADVAAGEDAAERYLQGGQSRSDGNLYSIATVPFSDPEGTRYDNLWVAILRGDTVCVEYLTPVFDETFLQNEAFLVDSGNIYRQRDLGGAWILTAANTYTFYGLDRLEGKTVSLMYRGGDAGTAVVTGGAASFTIDADLVDNDAAFETTVTTTFASTTAAFNSGFLRNLRTETDADETIKFAANDILLGEDGDRWIPIRDTNISGAWLQFLNIENGTTVALSGGTVQSDLAGEGVTNGVLTPGVGLEGTVCVCVGGTPYFIVPTVPASGASSAQYFAYYKINAASAIEFVGGCSFAINGLGGFQLVWRTDFNVASGNFYTKETGTNGLPVGPGNLSDCRLNYPIVCAGQGEGGQRLLFAPSVWYILNNSPANFAQNYTLFNKNLLDDVADLENFMQTEPYDPQHCRGFFLPGKDGRMLFYVYVRKELMVAHDLGTETVTCPLLATLSATSTDPYLFRFRMAGIPGYIIPTVTSFSTSAISDVGGQFPDVGLDFSGATGVDKDDYAGAYVRPTDPTDFTKPWLVAFYRHYDGDGERVGARIFMWDPDTETFTFQTFINGKMFDYTDDSVDTGYTDAARSAAFYISEDLDTMIFAGANEGANYRGVVTEFATLVPTTAQETLVDEAHIDGVIGCNYYSRLQLLRPDAGSGAQNGPSLAKRRRIDQFGLFLYRTGAIQMGADGFSGLIGHTPGLLDSAGRRALFTGVYQDTLSSDYNFDNLMTLQVVRPFPATITAISGFINTSDR